MQDKKQKPRIKKQGRYWVCENTEQTIYRSRCTSGTGFSPETAWMSWRRWFETPSGSITIR